MKREVDALKMLQAIRDTKITFPDTSDASLEMDNKGWFLLATRITLIMLETIAKSKEDAEKVIAKALRPRKPRVHKAKT